MTRVETAKLLAILKAAYPSADRDMTLESGEAVVSLWASALEPYPPEAALRAAWELIKKRRFMPSVAEMLAEVRSVGLEMRTEILCDMALGRDVPLERRKAVYGITEGSTRNAEERIGNSEEGNRRLQIEDPASRTLP